jgi:hypothetical protein
MRLALVAVVTALLAAGTASPAVPRKGCRPAQTTALVQRFVVAFNNGDARTLNLVWGGRLWFHWYAVLGDPGRRDQQDALRRDTLMAYFAARHAASERLTLTKLQINGATIGERGFEYRLVRSADDLTGGSVAYAGKGSLSCMNGRLVTWTMGVAAS